MFDQSHQSTMYTNTKLLVAAIFPAIEIGATLILLHFCFFPLLSLVRPHIYKTITLDGVCEELVKLGSCGAGKVVMKQYTQ